RLLLAHPKVELVAVTSRQFAGQTLSQVFPRFAGHDVAGRLRFVDPDVAHMARKARFVFLALPHGVAAEFAVPLLKEGCRVIDLSADFRLRSAATYREFYGHDHPAPDLLQQAVYGLPEVYRNKIRESMLVAAPGCYPTSILLPSIPLLREKLVKPGSIVVNSLSGVSGAGRKAELDYLFVECNESLRAYGIPKHRHLSEIEQELGFAAGMPVIIQFTPHLVPVNRGILTTLCFEADESLLSAGDPAGISLRVAECYRRAYGAEPFVRLVEEKRLPDTKYVVGTNYIDIGWRFDPRTRRLVVISAIDNLVKGAGGQAMQCFNLMNGFDETLGFY
ncbi:MAG: N-acetyl-gamma-glutamyl-phosphate reductase, partial [Verrucomicrobiae bacterium]|nr:N-acetyl-gamma-glutamyl-phosphate reductase [Verrucomicrobiae bacterium]